MLSTLTLPLLVSCHRNPLETMMLVRAHYRDCRLVTISQSRTNEIKIYFSTTVPSTVFKTFPTKKICFFASPYVTM